MLIIKLYKRCVSISNNPYLSVYQFNKKMKDYFNQEPSFNNIYVKGEVSDKYISPRGHLYFNLKDKRSHVPCIVYSHLRKSIGFEIENGMKLLVRANVIVYVPHGKYQLDILSATDEGLGKLTVAYQQLKKKLRNEGLFDNIHKKDLPEFPKRIGVITSKSGSVIHDIVKTVKKDWPYCHVLLFPASVQGVNSKIELVNQIKNADSFGVDTLIVGRGGGSLEELQSFNEESVVRAIYECKTPVITAIGHEDNQTLSDLVADKKASTPTMAASLAIKNKNDVKNHVDHLNSRLTTVISSKLDKHKKEFENILSKPLFRNQDYIYSDKKVSFKNLHDRFNLASAELINSNKNQLNKTRQEYVIRHPCKLQIDRKKSDLNDLETRLIDVMNLIINNYKVNLDKTIDNFNFNSQKLLTTKRHSLEISKAYFKTDSFRNQIELLKEDLISNKSKLNQIISLKLNNNQRDLKVISDKKIFKSPEIIYLDKSSKYSALVDKFKSQSNEIILKKSHELNSIRDSSVIKNPEKIYVSKYKELDKIKTSKIIKNPDMLLDSYKRELKIYEEKLDKINQVIMLKKEQNKQKRIYISIIVIAVLIIILIVIYGGII